MEAKRKRFTPTSQIRNKIKRSEVYHRQKAEKKKDKREKRDKKKREIAELGDSYVPEAKQIPRTLDNTRDLSETKLVDPNDESVLEMESHDEFANYFNGTIQPKVMITTKKYPSAKIFRLVAEFSSIVPNSYYFKRVDFTISTMQEWAKKEGFTHMLVLNEKSKVPNGLLVIHLATDGPCANFRLSSSMLSEDVPDHGNSTGHIPEVLLNNFSTMVGRRVSRLLGSLFSHNPEFVGRRVCTFHNQRDFIFFRQHRYVFSNDGKAASLQELGPRFTLKTRWMLKDLFDLKKGETEWKHDRKRMDKTRTTFHM
jgi:ribosome production factor 1